MKGMLFLCVLNGVVSAVVSVTLSLLAQGYLGEKAASSLARQSPAHKGRSPPSVLIPPKTPSEPKLAAKQPAPPPPAPAPPAPDSEWACTEEGQGHKLLRFSTSTEDGSPLVLEALILTQEHRWGYGRADRVVDPAGNEVDFLGYLEARGLWTLIRNARDIVTFGMASCEGGGSLDGQEGLADRRAEMLTSWLRTIPPNGDSARSFYKVNLGQYRGDDCVGNSLTREQTGPQRRVVIVYTTQGSRPDHLKKAELETKIEHSLQLDSSLFFDPRMYSREFRLLGG